MKSNVRDLTDYCNCIIIDAFAKCYTGKFSWFRDMETILSRTENEGLSFLTITLPSFGQEFERALDRGMVTSSSFSGWRKVKSLPAFLQGLTRLIFDADSGGLLNEPDIAAIEGIRQVAYTFKKLSLPCAPERERVALCGYKEIEHHLSDSMCTGDTNLFSEISDLLWSNVFREDYDLLKYVPRHGPGQTAEHISGNRKYACRHWTERLETFFPADSYLMSCFEQLDDRFDGINGVQFASFGEELPVKVTLVPKTLKGPRIIAMEPVCMQYAQQSLKGYIQPLLERHWLIGGHINFTDQSINQRLALKASHDRSLATLDLSSASDRVPLSLVSRMLRSRPDLRDAILACRSSVAQMPDGELISLSKFASMGSALCFPIESMYFFCVILTALFRKHNLPVTLRNMYKLSRNVYVYGDDIIIPIDTVFIVTETLTSFYCRVNSHKSFWTGKFRESCGMDAYDGECVTPTYLRQMRPCNKGEVQNLISWVATANLLWKKGYWVTANYMRKHVEQILGKLPTVGENSPALGWISFLPFVSYDRWNLTLHRFEVSSYVVSTVYRNDRLEGWSALLKFFLRKEQLCSNKVDPIDERHLERYPRSGTSSIKRRWATPY